MYFYLVLSGVPTSALALLSSGLATGPISEMLLDCPRPLPGATCLGYGLPRILSSYSADVTLVSVDGFPSIIDPWTSLDPFFRIDSDVTLAFDKVVVSNFYLFRASPSVAGPRSSVRS